jgi:hypothetical protein
MAFLLRLFADSLLTAGAAQRGSCMPGRQTTAEWPAPARAAMEQVTA